MRLPVHVADVLHTLGMHVMQRLLPVAGLFHAKLRRRTSTERALRRAIHVRHVPCVWAHAASMGELEQLVPVLERLRRARSDVRIVVTCTSPSGIDHAQRLHALIDDVAYLPADTPSNARWWLETIQPSVVLIDRYDLWRNHIVETARRSVPIVLINATAPSSVNGMLRAWTADTYRRCTSITAVTEPDAAALTALTGMHIERMSDTRNDRLVDRICRPDPAIAAYGRTDETTLVVGSSWPEDERLVIEALNTIGFKGRCIVVPHEPTEEALRAIESRMNCTRWSRSTPSTNGHLVVDSVGHLLSIYGIADGVWVGGGFGAGVHSLTEPAAYGLPVACGPRVERARDAALLAETGALAVCTDVRQAAAWLASVVCNVEQRRRSGAAARDYVLARTGTSDIIAARILALLPTAFPVALPGVLPADNERHVQGTS